MAMINRLLTLDLRQFRRYRACNWPSFILLPAIHISLAACEIAALQIYSARRILRTFLPNTGSGLGGSNRSSSMSPGPSPNTTLSAGRGSSKAWKPGISSRINKRLMRISIRVSSPPSSGETKV